MVAILTAVLWAVRGCIARRKSQVESLPQPLFDTQERRKHRSRGARRQKIQGQMEEIVDESEYPLPDSPYDSQGLAL
jgi:hypothetical protein